MRQREVSEALGSIPEIKDIEKALGKLKNGKAAGKSNILPEMLEVGERKEDFLSMLTDLVSTVWKERRVTQEWPDAILIPIPKKGNLQSCNNWRGIALLDVVGKLLAKIVQSRLQVLVEKELPESQCGFRQGSGCTDMIFMVRQLAEKTIEHQFLIFVNLHKAYDSVPREALWVALGKLREPDVLVDVVRSFHTNMMARVRVDGELLEEIGVNNGLRQGCTMAPTLFNWYVCVMAERWLERIQNEEDVGTRVLYKLDQQLFRKNTRNACEVLVSKGEFADDVELLASTRKATEVAIRTYMEVTQSFGLTVSIQKTKFMVVGHGVEKLPLAVDDGSMEWVSEFPYLGSQIAESGRSHMEVDKRITNASKAFGALRRVVFKNDHLSVVTKRNVYRACVLSVLFYRSECWVRLRRDAKKLNS